MSSYDMWFFSKVQSIVPGAACTGVALLCLAVSPVALADDPVPNPTEPSESADDAPSDGSESSDSNDDADAAPEKKGKKKKKPKDKKDEPAVERAGWVSTSGGNLGLADKELEGEDAWAALQRLPPNTSWEFAVQIGYTQITHFQLHPGYTGAYVGQGLRFAWGKNFNETSRIGFQVSFAAEGPIPLYYTLALEPMLSWDTIQHNVLIGASIGPSVLLHQSITDDTAFGLAPAAAVRIGYSQTWSRVGRRLFVLVEPRFRLMDGEPNFGAALVIGSGQGK